MIQIHSFKRVDTRERVYLACLWSTLRQTATVLSVLSPPLKSPSLHVSPDGTIQGFVSPSGKPGCTWSWILSERAQHCRGICELLAPCVSCSAHSRKDQDGPRAVLFSCSLTCPVSGAKAFHLSMYPRRQFRLPGTVLTISLEDVKNTLEVFLCTSPNNYLLWFVIFSPTLSQNSIAYTEPKPHRPRKEEAAVSSVDGQSEASPPVAWWQHHYAGFGGNLHSSPRH